MSEPPENLPYLWGCGWSDLATEIHKLNERRAKGCRVYAMDGTILIELHPPGLKAQLESIDESSLAQKPFRVAAY
jgi:hypothetical protein